MFNKRNILKKNTFPFILSALLISNHSNASNNTFDDVCESCHTGGFKGWISGAPNVEKKSDWQKYIERDSIHEMQKIVLNGSENHKVKGDCKSCSDEQIIEAIDYMMSLVK